MLSGESWDGGKYFTANLQLLHSMTATRKPFDDLEHGLSCIKKAKLASSPATLPPQLLGREQLGGFPENLYQAEMLGELCRDAWQNEKRTMTSSLLPEEEQLFEKIEKNEAQMSTRARTMQKDTSQGKKPPLPARR